MDFNRTADNLERGIITPEDHKTMMRVGITAIVVIFSAGFAGGYKVAKNKYDV